jgi:hypothetical protein
MKEKFQFRVGVALAVLWIAFGAVAAVAQRICQVSADCPQGGSVSCQGWSDRGSPAPECATISNGVRCTSYYSCGWRCTFQVTQTVTCDGGGQDEPYQQNP